MSEIKYWYMHSDIMRIMDIFIFTKGKIRINEEHNKELWFASCVSVANPENISGFHSKEILVILDEGAGIDEEIFVRLEGVMTTKGAKTLVCGNPSFTTGFFYDIFHKYVNNYYTFTFNCEKSENVEKEWIEYMADKYGEDSAVYLVRVKGEFAPMSEKIVITRKEMQATYTRKVRRSDFQHIRLGIDVASGEGSDKSVISAVDGKEEIFRRDYKMKLRKFFELIVKEIKSLVEDYEKVTLNIDTTGLGFQLGQDLEDRFEYYDNVEINKINFSNKAVNNNEYNSVVSEMFFELKKKIKEVRIIEEEECEEDICGRRFDFDNSNRYVIEKKKEFIKRIKRSPDYGDALLLAFYDKEKNNNLIEVGGV